MGRADDIYNTADGSIDATAEVVSLLTTQTWGTTIAVQPTGGDGKSGCNLTGGTSLGVRVANSNASVATVNPTSLTFTSCGDVETLEVTPVGVGSANITFVQTSNTTGASFNLATAAFTVNVSAPPPPADTTAPVISATVNPADPDGTNGWYTGAVTLRWTVTDAESAVSARSGCGDTDIVADQAATTYTCAATSTGGTNSQSVTLKRDGTGPVQVLGHADRAPNAKGWYNASVRVAFTGDDALSGIAACTEADYAGPDNGGASVGGSCTDKASNRTNGNFDLKYDATDPTNVAGAPMRDADHDGWYNAPVRVDFTGDDATSGVADCAQPTYSGPDGGSVTAQGRCTDNAGNASANVASAAFKYDATAPADVAGNPARDADRNGWYTAPVRIVFAGADATSGIASCTVTPYNGPDGGNLTVPGRCTDAAGNASADVASSAFQYDATAPTGVEGTFGRPADRNGWYNKPVNISFTGNDATSGIASCTVTPYNGPDGGNLTVDGRCTDRAGNASADVTSPAFQYDATAPTGLVFTGGITATSTEFYFGSVPAAPTCGAQDALSGMDGCVVSGYATTLGAHTLTATATDNAGNASTRTLAYTVLPWTIRGFHAPVDNSTATAPVYNTVKGGSAVPIKFEVFAGDREVRDPALVQSFGFAQVSCNPDAAADAIEVTNAGGTSLRFDATGDQFIQNWKTPTAPGCYRIVIKTADGSTKAAFFRITK